MIETPFLVVGAGLVVVDARRVAEEPSILTELVEAGRAVLVLAGGVGEVDAEPDETLAWVFPIEDVEVVELDVLHELVADDGADEDWPVG